MSENYGITDKGWTEIAKGLAVHTSLFGAISYFTTNTYSRVLAQLAATNRVFSINFLQLNKSLQTLYLYINNIGDEGAEALAEALKVVLGAQILIFRLETCFLFAFIVILRTCHCCHTLAVFFINVVANLPRQSPK